MADSIVLNQPTYTETIEIINQLATLENRSAANAIETLVKECGPAKIDRLKAEKKAREGK